MQIILVRGDQYEGTKLYRALFPLGYTALLATDPKQAQVNCQQRTYDRAMVWMSLFRVPNGASQLVSFLEGLPISQAVTLIVAPDMQAAVESIGQQLKRPLPRVSEVWVIAPADEQREIPARLDVLSETLVPRLQPTSSALPASAGQIPPAPETSESPVPAAPIPPVMAAVAPAGPPIVPSVVPAPAPVIFASPNIGAGQEGWVGLWSVRGGCGATTLAIELARLSAGRTLIGLDNPSLALALGLPGSDPWTPQAARPFPSPIVLGVSRYELPDSAVILDAIRRAGLPRLSAIVDLPSGPDPLTRAMLQAGLLSRLAVVLTPDRATVALAVHALSMWQPTIPVSLCWNMADWGTVNNARSGLSLLRSIDLSEAGILGQHQNVQEARNRCQSLTDAAADGVALGKLVTQIGTLAAALLPELASQNPQRESVPGQSDRRQRRKIVEIIND